MTRVALVLYENSTNQSANYPLHNLICAMVDDQLGRSGEWVARNRIGGNPRRGRDRLLRDCRAPAVERAFGSLPRSGRFALVDGDKIEQVLKLPGNSDLAQRRAALAEQYPEVQIFVPDASKVRASNTEGLLTQVAVCLGLSNDDVTVKRARDDKDMVARDTLFARAAARERGVRDCLRDAQPSLAAMVDALAALIRGDKADRAPTQ